MEPVLLLLALVAVTLAGVALVDVLTGPGAWEHKAGWALLVLGLPVIGPLVYFRRIAGGSAPRRGGAAGDRPRRSPPPPPAP